MSRMQVAAGSGAGVLRRAGVAVLACAFATACGGDSAPESGGDVRSMQSRVESYATVALSADLRHLTDVERRMLELFVEAAQEMDAAFRIQAYGNLDSLRIATSDAHVRRFIEINYGPWDRLGGNEPFVHGAGAKPPGANFYPADMTREEFERAAPEGSRSELRSQYTMVRRNEAGALIPVPYRDFFAPQLQRAAEKLREAAELSEDAALARYLRLRADALLSDDYRASDIAWLDMKENRLELVIGPIETYEDQLFGIKTAFEAFVLIKDLEWSDRLARYATLLPALQRDLPVPEAYKAEIPGTDSDLNAYDAVHYAGDANAGAKTIAINLPNDETVQLQKGTRRLQIKNTMRAKYDKIMVPIAEQLIAADQRRYVTFDAFFSNTMFHEVAHGLGIRSTVNGRGLVREALKEQASALEEGKADVLGLYMITRLHEQGELGATDLMDYYVTFVAGIFRSVRFGAASAHGRANIARFNFFASEGAFVRDPEHGVYRVEMERMREAVNKLSEKILRFQGDGDYDGVAAFMRDMGSVGPALQGDLDRLAGKGIPVDIVFEERRW